MRTKSLLQDQTYNTIIEQIYAHELVPGVLYSETKIASQLGTSRTPLREALQCLAQDGYITILPSRGFMIRTLNEQDMKETIQIRCALEGFCIRYLADEAGSERYDDLLRKLTESWQNMDAARTSPDFPESFVKYDHEFHFRILEYVGNQEMLQLFRRSMYLIFLTSTATLNVPGRTESTLNEHKAVLDCLMKHDKEGAYRHLMEHLKLPLDMMTF